VEVYLKSNAFGVITEIVKFHELIFERDSGKVLEMDINSGEEREIARLKPARDLKEFLEIVPELWNTVDEHEFVPFTQRSRKV